MAKHKFTEDERKAFGQQVKRNIDFFSGVGGGGAAIATRKIGKKLLRAGARSRQGKELFRHAKFLKSAARKRAGTIGSTASDKFSRAGDTAILKGRNFINQAKAVKRRLKK